MKIRHYFPLFAILCGVLLLTGCGSSGGSGGDQSASSADDLGSDVTTGIDYVGADTCIGCHEDLSWSADEVADFLVGAHVIHSDHITQENAVDGCLDCHDPVGDGPELASFIDAANVPAGGLAAVGCENCHGAGGDHYGVGPMPVAKPDYTACASCHGELPESHLVHHPEANHIDTKFVASRHFTASVRNEAICAKCHTDAGGKLYKDITTRDQLLATVLPVGSDAAIQCRTCHNPHNAGGLLFEDVEDHGHVVASGEYATCVSCHMGDNAAVADDGAGGTDWDATEVIYHQDAYYRIITDTHYDDPATSYESANLDPSDPDYAPNIIEGYVINPLSERACRDCHDVHGVEEIRADDDSSSFSDTINDQWSKSGHGGMIGSIKLAKAEEYDDAGKDRTTEQTVAIKMAGADSSNAFPHYDWDAENRQDCQECHTATGIHNYLSNPAEYNAENNDFSHLAGWSVDDDGVVTSSGQNELLYCTGCHSNNAGGLLDPGALTMDYTYNNATVTLPDVGNSNVCIHCHGGRGNIDNITSGSRSSRFAGHHGPAAGTLFSATTHIGYEYVGQSYADPVYFAHAAIGTVDEAGNEVKPGTGTSGPCAACHMPDSNHTFAVVSEDPDTAALTINSFATCAACHNTTDPAGDHYFSAAVLEEEKAGFEDAIALLAAYVTNTTTNAINTDISAQYSSVAIEYYGAFQNYKYMEDEPGAYAHNRYYAKRLIFDSIDWLQDGALTGTIDLSAATAEAAAWLGTSRP
ncbi:MAG: multiheme c-type cytochrome [Desulfuromonas sp.]|nr:multiheme c-type cytochrome [Desulfuromonas sp.]